MTKLNQNFIEDSLPSKAIFSSATLYFLLKYLSKANNSRATI